MPEQAVRRSRSRSRTKPAADERPAPSTVESAADPAAALQTSSAAPKPEAPAKPFAVRGRRLHCERVSLEKIAATVGTPAYIYSRAAIEQNLARFEEAFADFPHTICYSVKANSNVAILRLLARRGAGFDIVSAGELHRVLQAGGTPETIVFSGVGKTAAEMDAALDAGILLFNAESEEELKVLAQRARRMGRRARVALRVNPDVDAGAHPYISTGLRRHKFGVDIELAEQLYERAARLPALEVAGVSCHIGSQILDLAPFVEAFEKVLALADRLRERGMDVRYVDVGGGLGVPYHGGESGPDIGEYARRIIQMVGSARNNGYHVLLEPGRSLVGAAGILLTTVLYRKKTGTRNFLIVDAAMNDLLRPSLYGSYHEIRPVVESGRRELTLDVVGPICESGDFLARDRRMPAVLPGELLAVLTAGAYGSVLGSNYNSRPRPPEVLVDGKDWRVIRDRESYEDLIRLERP